MERNSLYITFSMVLLVLFLGLLIGFCFEGKRQKKIIALRNKIKSLGVVSNGTVNFIDIEPLVMDNSILLQENEGPDPGKENLPSFKVHNYGFECDLVSEEKGIWC